MYTQYSWILQKVMEHRLGWLKKWLELRVFDIGEARMDFLCIWYCTLKAFADSEYAQRKTLEINGHLMYPISEKKIEKHIFHKIDKREKVIRYRNVTIKEMLGITEDEYRILDPDCRKRERQERERRRIKKKEMENLIRYCYKELDLSQEEIRVWTEASKRKIERVLSPVAAAEKKNRDIRILELHRANVKKNKIAEIVGCNRNTVSKVLKNATFSPNLHISRCADEMSNLPHAVTTLDNGNTIYSSYKLETSMGEELLEPSEILTRLNDKNILIIGPAGSGKTYAIKRYLDSLSKENKRKTLIVAPTWKAAQNLDGITVHKAFGLSASIQNTEPITAVPKHLRGINTIIIDEISMLRVDVFNKMMQIIQYIEHRCKREIRIIAVGDFGQLQPVATQEDEQQIKTLYPQSKGIYCFQSQYWDTLNFKRILLRKIYRQTDSVFSEKLTQLKYGIKDTIQWFNNECRDYYNGDVITIVPTNDLVQKYNDETILGLWYYDFKNYYATFNGELTYELPAPSKLTLSPECRIMVLSNGKQYRNGQLGTVEKIEEKCIKVRLDDMPDTIVSIPKMKWTLDNGTHYTQYPVCLAYAITVNKAQGCTFDSINIDRGNGFWLPGQLYVALSRCRTAKGIHLLQPLKERDVHYDLEALKMTV